MGIHVRLRREDGYLLLHIPQEGFAAGFLEDVDGVRVLPGRGETVGLGVDVEGLARAWGGGGSRDDGLRGRDWVDGCWGSDDRL